MLYRPRRPPYPWRSLLSLCGQAGLDAVVALLPAVVAWPFIFVFGGLLLIHRLEFTAWLWLSVLLSAGIWLRHLVPAWRSLFHHEYAWNHRKRVEHMRQVWREQTTQRHPADTLLRPAEPTGSDLLRPAGYSGVTSHGLLRAVGEESMPMEEKHRI